MSKIKYSTTEGRRQFPELATRACYSHDVFAFERHGRPICALVSLDVLEIALVGSDKVDLGDDVKSKIMTNIASALAEVGRNTRTLEDVEKERKKKRGKLT